MSTLVAQPLPGIGDMVWHLPHIRAIAAHLGEPVTLLTKPRSLADQMLTEADPIREVMWVDLNPRDRRGRHDGIAGFARLARELRRRRFDRMILLHQSHRIACAGMLAGIARRQGYGWEGQRWFLTGGPHLPASSVRLHPFERASRFLELAGIPMAEAEPRLNVGSAARRDVLVRLGALPRPFAAFGIGGSETNRRWDVARFAGLGQAMFLAGWPAIVLVGGEEDTAAAAAIETLMRGPVVVRALGWQLAETIALLEESALCVANNTGVMNIAGAVRRRTYGLFGANPPFRHSTQIVPITCPGGPRDGVTGLALEPVLEAIRADRGGLAPPQWSGPDRPDMPRTPVP